MNSIKFETFIHCVPYWEGYYLFASSQLCILMLIHTFQVMTRVPGAPLREQTLSGLRIGFIGDVVQKAGVGLLGSLRPRLLSALTWNVYEVQGRSLTLMGFATPCSPSVTMMWTFFKKQQSRTRTGNEALKVWPTEWHYTLYQWLIHWFYILLSID